MLQNANTPYQYNNEKHYMDSVPLVTLYPLDLKLICHISMTPENLCLRSQFEMLKETCLEENITLLGPMLV